MYSYRNSSSETFFIYCVGQCLHRRAAFISAMAYEGIPAKPLVGRYNGRDEHSFISRMSDYDEIAHWLNAEESILHIHDYDACDCPKATLKFLSLEKEHELGRMVPTSKERALAQNAYTYDPAHKTYFICKQSPS